MDSQFAYLRGLDAFKEAQDIYQKINPKKLRQFLAEEREALAIFMQAYTSLQIAFKADLEENQRMLAVEMMSSMSQEFLKRMMVSPLETQYWNTLMVVQTAQKEYDGLKIKLGNPSNGPLAWIRRRRWTSRQKQLLRSLGKLDLRLDTLEKEIEFTDPPKTRDKTWKP